MLSITKLLVKLSLIDSEKKQLKTRAAAYTTESKIRCQIIACRVELGKTAQNNRIILNHYSTISSNI